MDNQSALLERLRPIAQIINSRDAQVAAIDAAAEMQLASVLGLGFGAGIVGSDCGSAIGSTAATVGIVFSFADPVHEEPAQIEAAPEIAPEPIEEPAPTQEPEAPTAAPVAEKQKSKAPKASTLLLTTTTKKNRCIDCGEPCAKERCQKHASTYSAQLRREAKKNVEREADASASPAATDMETLRAREIASAKKVFAKDGTFDLFSDITDGTTTYFAAALGTPVEEAGNVVPLHRFIRRGVDKWASIPLDWSMRKAVANG